MLKELIVVTLLCQESANSKFIISRASQEELMSCAGLLAVQQPRIHGPDEASYEEGLTVLTPSGSSGAI